MTLNSTDRKTELLDQESGSPTMVQVVAPLTLSEGATFAAKLDDSDGRFFTVTVPPGGVVEGQSFMVPLPPDFNDPRINAPYGHWKDGPFDFLSLGYLHSSFCCALCCTQIAMGQVMQRARLDWLGAPTSKEIAENTFKIVLALSIASLFFSFSLNQFENTYWANGVSSPSTLISFKTAGEFLFFLWSVYALYRTRRSIRERYAIPEERCVGCEDLCCSVFCSCCAVSQMARHTGEYETYNGVYLSETGLPPDAPMAL
jgi:Cys-rich protein (TIGR01571 family)